MSLAVPAELLEKSLLALCDRTGVEDVLKAARELEGRLLDGETSTARLLFLFPDHELFDTVLSWSLEQLALAWRCPAEPVSQATDEDPSLELDTTIRIQAARFRPKMESGPPDIVRRSFGEIEDWHALRVLVIEDDPHVLDLVAPSLAALHGILVPALVAAWNGAVARATEDGDGPRSRRRHRFSGEEIDQVLGAVAFHACGYELELV